MKRLIFTTFFLITTWVHAQIIEIKNIREMLPHIDENTLVIFDIDNTVMEPKQTLGSDQWFHHRIDVHKQKGFTESNALEKALHEWMSVQNVTEMQLVEPYVGDLIKELQAKKISTMGLTTRGLGLCTCTLHQLEKLSVDLSVTAPSQKEMHFINGDRGVLFRKGVLFCANTHKGHGLHTFLKTIGFSPKKIVFVNDKDSHLRPVDSVYEKIDDVQFIGLRYSYLDEKVKNFKPEVAEVQFSHFGKVISDLEATEILQKIR